MSWLNYLSPYLEPNTIDIRIISIIIANITIKAIIIIIAYKLIVREWNLKFSSAYLFIQSMKRKKKMKSS